MTLDLARFVRHEARLLDEKRWEEWYELFTEDGLYWVPLSPDQPDGVNHTSLAYEDRLLLRIRIERLRDRRAHAQHPPSRCHHLLGEPEIERAEDALFVTRTPFHYTEAQGDAQQTYVGTVFHHIVPQDGVLKLRLKRVDLLNCDAALPSIQLFP